MVGGGTGHLPYRAGEGGGGGVGVTCGPEVDVGAVGAPVEDLGGHVHGGPAEGLGQVARLGVGKVPREPVERRGA